MIRRLGFTSVVCLLACQGNTLPDRPFLAIARDASSTDALIVSPSTARKVGDNGVVLTNAANSSFYIAIKKKELGERWFYSSYLKQVHPYGVSGGAARSLGTRVVTFKVQNDKLFVFSADDIRKISDTFDPTILIDAYPLVTQHRGFLAAKGYDDYVLFDPASGQNSLGLFGEFAATNYGIRFDTELAFMERYRDLEDGITYEMVFSGFFDSFGADTESWLHGEDNQLKTSGTLGVGLRRYKEGDDFHIARPTDQAFYFLSDVQLVPNTGFADAPSAKWNIKPGMQPIKWLISDQFAAFQDDPDYAGLDIVGAVKAGITNWNEVFGFEALTADVADIQDSYADDDVNYVVFDGDPSYGAAFANWRTNPNTGEIRGASVYMNVSWITDAVTYFSDDEPAGRTPPVITARPHLSWGGQREQLLCEYDSPSVRRAKLGAEAAKTLRAKPGSPSAALTKKQKVESYITHTVVHEIGHTLGLRHNFKGSLVPPSSSVMDYLLEEDSFVSAHPGAYDRQALAYLYELSDEQPALPFCTDEDLAFDPTCSQFDTGADPLLDYWGGLYVGFLRDYLSGAAAGAPNNSLNNTLKFVRADADPEYRAFALSVALYGLQVGDVPPAPSGATGGYEARVDTAFRNVFVRLYLAADEDRGAVAGDPSPDDDATFPAILAELQGALANADGLRSFETRRTAVDILKKVQDPRALTALVHGQAQAQAAVLLATDATDATEKAELNDLLARIEAAITPYFN